MTPQEKQSLIEDLESRGFDKCYPTARYVRVGCSQCQTLVINGVATHETGCPNIVRYVDCHICGYPVRVGESCDCQEEVQS